MLSCKMMTSKTGEIPKKNFLSLYLPQKKSQSYLPFYTGEKIGVSISRCLSKYQTELHTGIIF